MFSVETAMKIALADRWNERAVILVDWARSRQKGCMECSRAGKELDGQRSGRTFCSAGKFWLAEGVGKFLFGGRGGQIFVLPANSCTGQTPVVGEFVLGRGKFLLGGQIHVLAGRFLLWWANFCFAGRIFASWTRSWPIPINSCRDFASLYFVESVMGPD